MKNVTICLLILLFINFVISCSENGDKNFAQTAAKKYTGQTIHVIVPKLHARLISGPILDEVEAFQKQTGAKVRVVTPGWNETIKKINQSLVDPELSYDIFVVIAMWNGTLLGNNHIEAIPESIKQKIDWEDVLPIYRDSILSWNNTAYGLPYDGDCINLYYRKDLFANSVYQERFKQRYAYPLDVPETWDEFKDVAEFFHGWDWDNDGEIEYGLAGNRVKGDISMLQFFAQAGAFAKHPEDKAYYFDADTLKPRINNPGFVKALQNYIDLTSLGPPGMANFAGHDVRNSFVSGEVALAIDWADMGIYAVDSPISIVADKVGYAQIPASKDVYNSQSDKWDERFNQVASISGNWMFLINQSSKNKQLAFEFAAHMTSKELTNKLTAISGNAVNPSRYSHFDNPSSWQQSGFSTQSAKAYLDEIKVSLSNKNVTYDITIPGAAEYYQVADKYVYKALLKEMSPQEAMDKAALEWENITEKLGRKKQISFYRSSLNI